MVAKVKFCWAFALIAVIATVSASADYRQDSKEERKLWESLSPFGISGSITDALSGHTLLFKGRHGQ